MNETTKNSSRQHETQLWNTEITTYDCDRSRNLRPSAQLRLQQEIGERHLNAFGLSYGALFDRGIVFVLTSAAAHVIRPPKMSEKITIETWSRGPKGALFYRNYDFRDSNGNLLISAASAFALIEPATRRLLRPKIFDEQGALPHLPDRKSEAPEPGKITLPEGLSPCGTRLVRYSDIDYNHHMNNTVYGDFICDFLPNGMPESAHIAEFKLHFAGEALLGDEIAISAMKNGSEAYLYGAHARGACFSAFASLEP